MRLTLTLLFITGSSLFAAGAPSFRNQVQPILAKAGCSTGACHGAAAGQGGFKLSLLGYDNLGDHLAITHAANGRRVVFEEPARSLFLLKATKTVPHKGGEKVKAGSAEYQLLADWIAAGAPGPQDADARIQTIEITPGHVTLKPGAQQPLKVMATFSDGRYEDVTRWCKYTAGNTSVATIDDNGLVKVGGQGEGTITAWFLSRLSIATITVPYEQAVNTAAFTTFQPRNFIDERVIEKLHELNVPPSPRCTDEEFIRRAFIDTIGVLPTPEETLAFLADKGSSKRDALVEALLKRPELERPAAGEQQQAAGHPDVELLPVDPAQRGAEYTVGRVRARAGDRHRQHAGERRGQLFHPA